MNLFDLFQRKKQSQLLNIGCGSHFHPDWVNVDVTPQDPAVIQHDIQGRLPFKDGTFKMVYHSHVLEHLSRAQAAPFLKECHRVLARGGIIRIAVPDLEMIVRLYLKFLDEALAGNEESADKHEWMILEMFDQMVREKVGGGVMEYWRQNPMPAEDFVIERAGQEVTRYLGYFRSLPLEEQKAINAAAETAPTTQQLEEIVRFRQQGEIHRWMYDRVSLKRLLEKCGFKDAAACTATESRLPGFRDFNLDSNPDGTTRKPDSLFMEALKP